MAITKSTQDRLLELDPEAQLAVATLLQLASAQFPQYNWGIGSGYRSPAEQDKLFAKGPGVTRARGGRSMHNYGLAADVYPFTKEGIPSYKDAQAAYDYMGEVANNLNMTWGGTPGWGGPPGDYGHVQTNFDPEGKGYDYQTAISANMVPPAGQHWQTRNPKTGQVLKGRKHETFIPAWREDRSMDYGWFKGSDGKYYSVPTAPADYYLKNQ
jgi:hypothetical protein